MEPSHHETRSVDGWRRWELTNAEATDQGIGISRAIATTLVTDDIDAVDISVDDRGTLHVLDSTGFVHRYDRNTDAITPFPLEVGAVSEGRALCVSRDSVYIADGADGSVRSFSSELRQLRWRTEAAFARVVAMDACGRTVSILSAGTEPGDGRLDHLSTGGDVTTVAAGLTAPIDLTTDRTGTHYVLDADSERDSDADATIVRAIQIVDEAKIVETDDADSVADPENDGHVEGGQSVAVTNYQLPLVLQGASSLVAVQAGELLIGVDPGGNDSGGVDFSGADSGEDDGTMLYRWRVGQDAPESIERIEHSCTALAAPDPRGEETVDTVYSIADRSQPVRVYRLDPDSRPTRNDRTGRYDAQAITRLDAGVQGTTWHRVLVGLDHRGRDTQVRLQYRATDDALLADSQDLTQLDGIGTGYETRLEEADVSTVADVAASTSEELSDLIDVSPKVTRRWPEQARTLRAEWMHEAVDWRPMAEPNPTDALLHTASGRYLWVKIELIGTEHASPQVSRFSVSFPRETMLEHLPDVYREAAARDPFVERYLSLFSSVFTDIDAGIDSVTRFMDPDAIPAEGLPWLGEWMAVDVDETWPESAQRELLSRAPDLATQRGTRRGLLAMCRIFLDHTRTQSAWRVALDRNAEAVLEAITDGACSPPVAARRLTDSEDLSTLSGDAGLTQLLAAWSRVVVYEGDLLDQFVADGTLSEEDADEEREATRLLIHDSDEGSLRHVVEYASVLEEFIREEEPLEAVTTARDEYGRLIRRTATRTGPYLFEGPDLDCIDSEIVRKPFENLVGHDRGFVVLTRASSGSDRLRTVQRIVRSEQPAHATGHAAALRPWIRLGDHSYLGINSALSAREFVLGRSELGWESVLHSREQFAQLDVRATLDGDSFIS